MQKGKILNIGGDSRQVYLINHLLENGFDVSSSGLFSELLSKECLQIDNYKEALQSHEIILCPTPFSKDGKQINTIKNDIIIFINELKSLLTPEHLIIGGNIPVNFTDALNKKNIHYLDLLNKDAVAIENAVSTAEGAIAKAIMQSPINLNLSNCLIIGFGRCGKVLAHKLSGLGAKVSITTRSKDNNAIATSYGYTQLSYTDLEENISSYDFIFNTAPALVLTSKALSVLNPDVTIIDIASVPGGLDYDYVNKAKVNAYLYLGIPGKISPKSSGIILANAIIDYLNERSD